MKLDHALGHGLTGGIGIKAAIDGQALGDERWQPRRVGSGTGGGEGAIGGMQGVATEGVDGRFAQDYGLRIRCADGEEAMVFAGARRQSAPRL